MASAFGHAAVAITGTTFIPKELKSWKVALIGIVVSIIPDLDVIGFSYGIEYEHWLGHRGLSHSILFNALLALLLLPLFHYRQKRLHIYWMYYAFCGISHGVLDAMTSGGRGVGFFIPFNLERFFLPWRPIQVSPLSIEAFFNGWGLRVLQSEAVYIGIPCLVIFLISRLFQLRT